MVEVITREIFKKLTEEEKNEENLHKKILVLDKNYKAYLRKLLDDATLSNIILNDIDAYEDKEIIEPYETVIVPSLSIDDHVNIALGLRTNVITRGISDALLHSKKIILLEEGLQYNCYKKSSNSTYSQMLEDYLKRIQAFGIIICNEVEILKHIEERSRKEPKYIEVIDLKDKKVITEGDLQKHYKTGCQKVLISNKAVITPLARDYIREKNIKLIF